jgi:hypothetical protein
MINFCFFFFDILDKIQPWLGSTDEAQFFQVLIQVMNGKRASKKIIPKGFPQGLFYCFTDILSFTHIYLEMFSRFFIERMYAINTYETPLFTFFLLPCQSA